MKEKFQSLWQANTMNKVVIVGLGVAAVYFGKKAWDKRKK